jgi:DNA polymerase III delta subunit
MIKVFVGKNGSGEELDWEKMSIEEFASLASTQSMFGGVQTFVLSNALSGERADEFLDMAASLKDSPHTFIFEEEKLLKKPTDALAKAGVKVEILRPKASTTSKSGFDQFGLTTAFASRDKKTLWLNLLKALRAGEKPEAIAGLLHWKVRNMLETRSTKYSAADLTTISRQLVCLYHDSHRGAGSLDLLLERFALTL